MSIRKHHWLLLVVLGPSLAAPLNSAAQGSYPDRPVRLIVGFPPGGSTDLLARVVGQQLSVGTGQQVVIDNRTGGGGNIGNEIVARATPDGHTLMMAISGLVTSHVLNPRVGYDPLRDFTPIVLVATSPYNVVVHPGVQATTIQELLALLRANPGKLNVGTSGTGGGMHLAVEYFKMLTRTDAAHVPYRGTGPAITDLIAGRIQLMFAGSLSSLPHIKTRRVRALATTGARRSSALPELPTVSETIVQGYEAGEWFGILGPARMAPTVVARLHREVTAIIDSPDFQVRLVSDGAIVGAGSPADFGAFIQREHRKWARVVAEAKIQPE